MAPSGDRPSVLSPDELDTRSFDDDLEAGLFDPEERIDFDAIYDADQLAAIDAGIRPIEPTPVTPVASWRRRSAMGAVLTGLALGLKEVFEPDDEAQIVVEVDDEGLPNDLPVQLFLDPDSPAGSLCIVHRTDAPPPVV